MYLKAKPDDFKTGRLSRALDLTHEPLKSRGERQGSQEPGVWRMRCKSPMVSAFEGGEGSCEDVSTEYTIFVHLDFSSVYTHDTYNSTNEYLMNNSLCQAL